MMSSLESKIKGALYGFAIGDAMGATTEFMSEGSIKAKYGKVKNIIGGGWLNLAPGEVTDDTQMMMCVCEAINYAYGDKRNWSYHTFESPTQAMLSKCCDYFIQWYLTNPPDIGGCCRRVISSCLGGDPNPSKWMDIAANPNSLGNGSLMRTLPIILAGLSEEAAISQGRLTHNNYVCDMTIHMYYQNMERFLYEGGGYRNVVEGLYSPEGHVVNTLNNALYWVQHTPNFKKAILGAVNHGGDADTIAAITGSLAGAFYGYEAIPSKWIDQLDPDVRRDLDKYAKLFEKINKKVCTNVK